MSKTKWTKGPWIANDNRDHDGGHPWTIWTPNGPGFGMVAHAAPYCPPQRGDSRYDECAANAHLIAAAPELYEALVDAQEELRLLRMKDTEVVYDPTLCSRIAITLAKARGEK